MERRERRTCALHKRVCSGGGNRIKWRNSACFRQRIFQFSRSIVEFCYSRFQSEVLGLTAYTKFCVYSQTLNLEPQTGSLIMCYLWSEAAKRQQLYHKQEGNVLQNTSHHKWATVLPTWKSSLVVSALTKSGARHSVKCIGSLPTPLRARKTKCSVKVNIKRWQIVPGQ